MFHPTSSLIISTYNWPEALELSLLSVMNQKLMPNEVIIADDGSTEETKQLIESFQNKFPVPLIHIWHEDKGFHKAIIINKAVATSKFDYIIQVDGDIIMDSHFVNDHLMHAKKGVFLFGSRVNIKKSFLSKLFKKKIIKFNLFSVGINKRFRTIRIPLFTTYSKEYQKISSKLRGCNLSFWKKDFIKINGYNELFLGWGGEDYELCIRLYNNGIVGKRLKFAAVIYHIFHPESSKDNVANNWAVQCESIENKCLFTADGIDKYLK